MIQVNIKKIVSEIKLTLSQVDEEEVKELVLALIKANRVVVAGAGRVGMATRAFGMRLAHLGLESYVLGDANVPGIGKGDLLLVSSGSGETQTIYDVLQIAKMNGCNIALLTANPKSRMGRSADIIIKLPVQTKIDQSQGVKSIQPMTTLNEQCIWIFYDAVVLELMSEMKIKESDMWKRHSNLE